MTVLVQVIGAKDRAGNVIGQVLSETEDMWKVLSRNGVLEVPKGTPGIREVIIDGR